MEIGVVTATASRAQGKPPCHAPSVRACNALQRISERGYNSRCVCEYFVLQCISERLYSRVYCVVGTGHASFFGVVKIARLLCPPCMQGKLPLRNCVTAAAVSYVHSKRVAVRNICD